ncbi:MAG TPA: 5'-3' exonuclease H3TH domain-containing protein [Candidatus Dormibacteraeota bacterium]|nr:5'-3' exonuclease H3TH domain-containing protein [Candidatus Dormibacteraeota bacterium]
MPEWLLADGSSLIFRAFYGVPQTTRAPDGTLVNAVRGFLDTLARLITERRPHSIAVTTDEDWRPDWRVELIPSYKVHRTAEPVPHALEPQMPVIMDCLEAVGVDAVGASGYEAEDVIASLVAKVKPPIEIVSGDRDLFSLIRDPDVLVLYPEKGGLAIVDEAEVERRYSIPGRAYADFAMLRGDPSDGLPGVAGIGAKKAADLVRRYGSVEAMLKAAIFRSADAEYLEKARRVVPPVSDLKIEVPRGRRERWPDHPDRVKELGVRYGIASSFERLLKALASMP